MNRPLQYGDPAELGPFRLSARVHESAAGIVYLGTDAYGRQVSIALLTSAAAGDAAARDRFRAAILAEASRPGPTPPHPAGGAPVVASQPEGEAPWVATAYEEGGAGAERFLEPVLLRRGWGARRRRGPQFQPYWLSGPKGPALRTEAPPEASAGTAAATDGRGLAAAVLALAALLMLLALLVVLLFSCEPSRPEPPPITRSPVPTTTAPTPTPTSPRPTPSPSPSKPRPSPTGEDSKAPANPAGR